ncbi:hypothetical protein GCM10009830_47800 [Glycomyces endophyticus]|uniref:DUF3592 domain-containing protein n=1 Tax=Glycomyces endophyticus TaxID=480996 RepID=A0ABN2HVW9_9ACTN
MAEPRDSRRRERALAVIPPGIVFAATAHLLWTAMFAPDVLPDWWFAASIILVAAALAGFFASCCIGRFRGDIRGMTAVLAFIAIGGIMLAPVFESSVLNARGVGVECTVVSSRRKEHRGDTLIEHTMDCPGRTGVTWSTDEDDRWISGDRVVGHFDPEDRAHYSFGDRDWFETVLWGVGALLAVVVAIVLRLLAVDDAFRARLTGGAAGGRAAGVVDSSGRGDG